MSGKSKKAPPSVQTRLIAVSKELKRDFQLVLQRYAAERLLHRIGVSRYNDRFVLKGAMLFVVWGEDAYRPTRDLDLLGFGASAPDAVAACFREICQIPVPRDDIRFFPETLRADAIRRSTDYKGVRVKLISGLEKARISLQVDIGFGDDVFPKPQRVSFPALLGIAGPRILAYPREAVVAEKLHATLTLGEQNSRMKDFYDLFVFSRRYAFQGDRLVAAVRATFARLKTEIPPSFLPGEGSPSFFGGPEREAMWRAFLSRSGLQGVPQDFLVIGQALSRFLSPLLKAACNRDAFPLHWNPGGLWKSARGKRGD